MDAAAVEAGDENWTSAGDLVRVLRALAVPGELPDEVRLPVLKPSPPPSTWTSSARSSPRSSSRGQGRLHERALHDTGLVGPPGVAQLATRASGQLATGPLAVAICSSPPASKDALRATARAVLEPFLG